MYAKWLDKNIHAILLPTSQVGLKPGVFNPMVTDRRPQIFHSATK